MYPILRNPRGSLMRKCDSDKHALAVSSIYHFYVDETAATNGDGTESSPWNNINSVFDLSGFSNAGFIYYTCYNDPCARVVVHVEGPVNRVIDSGVLGVLHYKKKLTFVPWRNERVIVNPDTPLNIAPTPRYAMYGIVRARGFNFVGFDFVFHPHFNTPLYSSDTITCIQCYRQGTDLFDCTIDMYVDASATASSMYFIHAYNDDVVFGDIKIENSSLSLGSGVDSTLHARFYGVCQERLGAIKIINSTIDAVMHINELTMNHDILVYAVFSRSPQTTLILIDNSTISVSTGFQTYNLPVPPTTARYTIVGCAVRAREGLYFVVDSELSVGYCFGKEYVNVGGYWVLRDQAGVCSDSSPDSGAYPPSCIIGVS